MVKVPSADDPEPASETCGVCEVGEAVDRCPKCGELTCEHCGTTVEHATCVACRRNKSADDRELLQPLDPKAMREWVEAIAPRLREKGWRVVELIADSGEHGLIGDLELSPEQARALLSYRDGPRAWAIATVQRLIAEDWRFLRALAAAEHHALVGGDAFGHDYGCDNAAADRLRKLPGDYNSIFEGGAVDYQGFSEHWQWRLNERGRALLAYCDTVARELLADAEAGLMLALLTETMQPKTDEDDAACSRLALLGLARADVHVWVVEYWGREVEARARELAGGGV